jgi:hypothetical protein
MYGFGRMSLADLAAATLAAVGLFVAFLGPLVFLVECVEWLTRQEWPGFTLADGLTLLGVVREVEETDAQRWHDLLLALPLSITLYFGGLMAFFGGLSIGDWHAERDFTSQFLSDD